jgi:hypothetical protein
MTGWFLIDDHSLSFDSINNSDVGHHKLSSKQHGDNCTGTADVEGNSQKLPSFTTRQVGIRAREVGTGAPKKQTVRSPSMSVNVQDLIERILRYSI